MKKILTIILLALSIQTGAQNFGVGTGTPTEMLEVFGKTKANGIIITIGGAPFDFIIKNDATGELNYRKGHGAVAMNYIICTTGIYPARDQEPLQPVLPNSVNQEQAIMGTVRLFAGIIPSPPRGWAFCNGQILSIVQNTALFSLLGTTYGGNGITTFALPDLRALVPVGPGTSSAGYSWVWGQKSD